MDPHLGDAQAKCLEAIKESGNLGLTCEEVEAKTGLRHQSASARVRELATQGFIADKGIRRRTASGRPAIIWIQTPKF